MRAGNGTEFDVCVVRDPDDKAIMHQLPAPWPGESKTASGDKVTEPEAFWLAKGGEALETALETPIGAVEGAAGVEARDLAWYEARLKAAGAVQGLAKDLRRRIARELEALQTGKEYDKAWVEGLKT